MEPDEPIAVVTIVGGVWPVKLLAHPVRTGQA